MKYILLFIGIIILGDIFAQNNWTATNGPFGGNVSSLKRSPSGTLYSIIGQRLYQSSSNADTWTLTPTTSPAQLYINDLMIDTDGKMYGVYFSTLYTSADNGINWTITASNLFQNGTKIEKVGPDKVFVVWGYSGVYISIDKGITWKQISTEQVSNNGIGLVSNAAGDIFYATSAGKLFKHSYQGLTANWSTTNFIQTTFTLAVGDYFSSMAVDGAGNLYVTSYYDFYKSTNAGTSFASIKANLSPLTYFYGVLAASPDNSISLFLSDKIYKSINQGTNWTNTPSPAFDFGSSVTAVNFASASTYFIGTGEGVFRTSDTGSSWQIKNNGMTASTTDEIVITNAPERIIVTKYGKGYSSSTDKGATWNFNPLSNYISKVLKLTDGTILLYGQGYILRSIDNGATFSTDNIYRNNNQKIIEATNGDLYAFYSLYVNPNYVSKIAKSTNKGATWTDLAITGLPTSNNAYVTEAAIDASNNIMFHGWDGSAWSTYKVVTTTATLVSTPYSSNYENLFFQGNKFYATQFSAYYYTTDLGATWTTVGFSGNKVFPIKNATYSGIAVSKNGSLQITQDDGGTWNNTNLPVSTSVITSVAADAAGDYFASASGSSVLKFTNELLVDPSSLPPYINFNWQPLNGPYGGTITKIKAHPDGSTLFAIANGNFVWKYNGSTWTRLDPIPPFTTIFDVELDPAGNVYIIGGTSSPQKIYKSTDKGVTWSQLTSTGFPASGSAIRRLDVLSDNSILAYGNFGGFGRIFKSTNGGATFTERHTSAFNVLYSRIPVESAGGVLATVGTQNVQGVAQYPEGLMVSLDRGTTWTIKPFPSIVGLTGFVGSMAFDGTTLLATVILDSSIKNWVTQLVKSTDNGTTWTIMPTPGPVTNISYGKRFVVLPNGEYLLTLQSPFFDCYRSTDKGSTWTLVGNYGDIFTTADFQGTTAYFQGSTKGVQKTTDGGLTITPVSGGMPINTAFDINLLNGKDLLVGATSPYHSSDFGQNFTLASSQVANTFLKVNDGVIAYGSKQLQKSTDGGKTYTPIGDDRYFSFLTTNKAGTEYYAYSSGEIPGTTVAYGLFFSTDLITWTPVPLSGLPNPDDFGIYDMVIDDNRIAYAIIADNETGEAKVYKVVFGSATDISQIIGTENPYSITYFNNKIYIYDGNGVIYKSSDGDTWTSATAPAGGSLIVTNNYLFVPGNISTSLWLSRDDGNAWQNIGDVSTPGVNFRDIIVNEYDGYAYATLSGSVVRKSGNKIIPNDNAKPQVASLLPALNAVNVGVRPTLTITFNEAVSSVPGKKIRIFDQTAPAVPVEVIDISAATQNLKSWSFTPTQDLSYLKTYFIIIDAAAFADIFGNTFNGITTQDIWKFTVQEQPDITKPTITSLTPDLELTKGTAKKIDINVTDNKNLPADKAKIYYRGITTAETELFTSASMVVVTGSGTTSSNFTVTAQEGWYDAMGLEFYIEVEDASGNKQQYPETGYAYSYITYPSADNPIIPSERFSFGGLSNNYRMISFPYSMQDGQLLTILNEFGNLDNTKWRIFNYDAVNSKFIENPPIIERNKGYWINAKTKPGDIKIEGASTPKFNRTKFDKITLKPGWNQIGNPYPIEISWADTKVGNANVGSLKIFDGTAYANQDNLLPFQGGFVNNSGTSDITLTVRFKGITTGGRIASGRLGSDLSESLWEIPISALNNGIENTMGGVGMHEKASKDWDQYDDVNPPRFFDYAELSFPLKPDGKLFIAKNIVPTEPDHMWEFTVDASEGITELKWDNEAITGDKDLILFDLTQQKLIDMKEVGQYSFNPKQGNEFQIHFGSDLHGKIKPTRIMLSKPFPNPTAAVTSIGFTVPENKSTYQVQLEVYNSMGQRVTQLVNGGFTSGFYATTWDTENQKNGLYFYRLKVIENGVQKTLTEKIIINR
jgi:photosystem II stability/assembly factor-like uncharacterized protein